MNTHPEKWYIPVTEENIDELNRWRLSKRPTEAKHWDSLFVPGAILLSKHPVDDSYFWAKDSSSFIDQRFPEYKPITLEQFRQITNSTPNQKPMAKSIQIFRELLNEYYEASTPEQRAYLTENFKLDGTTTNEAIRGLHEMACSTWKVKIRANHPDCFPEDSKDFDFSTRGKVRGIVSDDVADSLGMRHEFIQIRNNNENPATHYRSFYLTTDYNWKLVQDGTEGGDPVMVLIPTKK